jgi:hypothetical protein
MSVELDLSSDFNSSLSEQDWPSRNTSNTRQRSQAEELPGSQVGPIRQTQRLAQTSANSTGPLRNTHQPTQSQRRVEVNQQRKFFLILLK